MVKRYGCLLLLAMSCSSEDPITELVLSADSDLRLDRIVFEVSAQGVPARSAQATRPAKGPSYVSIVRDQGTLGPLTVVARGMFQNAELLRRTHVVSFTENESLVVPLDLYARCINAKCQSNQTCAENGCTPIKLDRLEPWTGDPPAPFAGRDGGTPQFAACGQVVTDLTSDARHCGDCARSCTGAENCVAGTCVRK
ncbi:MAG TPA: hypothetical protein VI299_17345 [Polyangiales bacterium]